MNRAIAFAITLGLLVVTTIVLLGVFVWNEPKDVCIDYHDHFKEYLFPKDSTSTSNDYLDLQIMPDSPDDHQWPYTYTDPLNPDHSVTGYYLKITSQTYLNATASTAPIWWHRVIVLIPNKSTNDTNAKESMLIYNQGGNNRNADGTDNPNAHPDPNQDKTLEYVKIAKYTGTVTALIYDNPNQPFIYEMDPTKLARTEDAIIAYSWIKFIENIDNLDMVLQAPMTKVVTSGFSAMVDYLRIEHEMTMRSYVVSGMSKRGWTSWLSCAYDDRCIGAAPIVFDLLKMKENLKKHNQALQGWTYAFFPYYNEGLTRYLDSPEFEELQCYVDPWTLDEVYKTKKTPIFHTGGTGDEFFLLQDTTLYASELKESGVEHWIRHMPNVAHDLRNGLDYYSAIRVFYNSCAKRNWDTVLPKYSWEVLGNASFAEITITLEQEWEGEVEVLAWSGDTQTENPNQMRDFRLNNWNGAGLTPNDLIKFKSNNKETGFINQAEIVKSMSWKASFEGSPDKSLFRAVYLDVSFTTPGGDMISELAGDVDVGVFTISSEPVFLPGVLPFEACEGDSCYGAIV